MSVNSNSGESVDAPGSTVSADPNNAKTITTGKHAAPATQRAPEALVGQTLRGTYRIVNVLDEGGMGTVYAAEHVRLRRQVAVKVVASHLTRDANALTRFQREAEIVSQLHHPHIVHILDFDTTEAGEPYIVMEYLAGEPLTRRLDRDGSLSLRDALAVVCQVASGLHVAHHAGIVHRDLKPDNIFLLSIDDQGIFVKLLDFGISKALGGRGTRVTQEFDVIGTPEYMAPEQAQGRTASLTHHSDQFSLAAIAYEAFTGVIPFAADSVMQILQKVINHQPEPIHTLVRTVPPAASAVVARALSKNPLDRYDSISEFAAALVSSLEALTLRPQAPSQLGSSPPPALAPPRPAHAEPARSINGQAPPADVCWLPAAGRWSLPPPDPDPVTAVPQEIEGVRLALAFGEQGNAYKHAQRALEFAERDTSSGVKAAVAAAGTLLEGVLLTQLGGATAVVAMLRVPASSDASLTPHQAYLLSRLDGSYTVDEVIDLSPFSSIDTLRSLLLLRDRGILRID